MCGWVRKTGSEAARQAFPQEAQKMRQSPIARMLAWVYAALAAFTALSVIIPIIWDRRARARREER